MANISLFEVSELSFSDSLISDLDKTTSREVILSLTGLEAEFQLTKIFILLEKDKNVNFIFYYKSKYHRVTSTIADYLTAVMIK